MSNQDKVNRRDFIVTTARIAGAATNGATSALAQTKPPPGFDDQKPLLEYWDKRLNEVVELNKVNFDKDTRELQQEADKELHRIYCHLRQLENWTGPRQAACSVAHEDHPLYLAGILRSVLGRDVTRRSEAGHLPPKRFYGLQGRKHHVQSGQSYSHQRLAGQCHFRPARSPGSDPSIHDRSRRIQHAEQSQSGFR